jgi:hypothetical protein
MTIFILQISIRPESRVVFSQVEKDPDRGCSGARVRRPANAARADLAMWTVTWCSMVP